jgi:glycosyltransferase involved in cell wall biosynthesis
MSPPITPLVLTYNEAPNIGRCLDRLTWAGRIVVIDSFSTDGTTDIVRSYPQAELIQRPFDSFADQCNYGLGQIDTQWVLSMDADYILPVPVVDEMLSCCSRGGADGFVARFKYCIQGKPLRSGLYPPRTVLYRREKAHYRNDGHGHRVHVQGSLEYLRSCIYHDDRKSLDRWLQTQKQYTLLEANKLLACTHTELGLADRIRMTKVLAPVLVVLYCLFLKGGVLDGWAGLYYALQRAVAETLLTLQLVEAARLRSEHELEQGLALPIHR